MAASRSSRVSRSPMGAPEISRRRHPGRAARRAMPTAPGAPVRAPAERRAPRARARPAAATGVAPPALAWGEAPQAAWALAPGARPRARDAAGWTAAYREAAAPRARRDAVATPPAAAARARAEAVVAARAGAVAAAAPPEPRARAD